MVTFRAFRNSLLVLPLLLASAVVPTVQAGRVDEETNRPSMEWNGSDDFQFANRAFSAGSRLFYAGPQWFLDVLPGSKRAATRYVFDRAGDRADSYTAYNGYVGTLRDVFDVGLFSIYRASTFAGPSAPKASNPLIVNTTGGGGVFYLGSGGNWDDMGAWGPDANMYPNAQSAVATDLQTVNGAIVQNLPLGVALGIIDHNPTTPFNSAHMVHWTITTDNLIVLNNGASPAQIKNSQSFGITSLTIDGAAGLSLTSDVVITNSNATGFITISAPIVGNGGVTVGGIGTTLLTGDNTFYGATLITSGTLNVGGAHSLGGGGSGLTTGLGTASVTVNAGGTLLFSGTTTDRIKNDAPIFLDGGTLNTAGLSEYTAGSVLPGMGALTLNSTSTIDLGAISSIIAFADSSDETWAGTLRILNWTGMIGVGNGTDQVYFGTDALGLDPSQLDQILLFSDADGLNFLGTAMILSTGEVVPVPEPATWIGAILTLVALAFTQRKRFASRSRVIA